MAFARTAVSITGTLTNGSASVTSVSSTSQLFTGMLVYGVGIQADTVINTIAGTTITLSKNATASGSTVITGQYITQTGTDADPSGLSGLTGVTTITQGTGILRRTVYDLGTNQLRIQGTLTHDPDLFEIISNVQNGVKLETGGTWNYGVARTANGQTVYSKGTGLVFTYNGALGSQFGLWIGGGTFNWNGGVIKSAAPPLYDSGTWASNTYNSIWQNANAALDHQIRCLAAPTFNAITLTGITFGVLQFLNAGFNAASIKYENTAYQTPGGGGVTRTLLNPVFIGNQSTADVRLNQLSGTQTQITQIKNPDRFPVVARLNNNARGDIPVIETLTLTISDSSNAAAANVVGYIKDSNNGARINSSGTPSNNYTSDRVYVASSNASGVLSMGDILTLAVNEVTASTTAINYDYRSNFGNNSADFNVYLGGYEYTPTLTRQTLMGNGGKSVAWTMFDDTNVTLTRTAALAKLASSFTVNPTTKVVTVTANSTYDDVYDVLKAWKYNGTQVNAESPTINTLVVSAYGENLTAADGWTLVVNAGVTLSEGSKFTYVYFPTITNNGSITGIYASTAGTSTIWRFESVQVGSSIVVYDSTGVTKYFQGSVTSAGDYNYYIPPGTTGTYYWAIEKYGKQRESGSFAANTGGLLFYAPLYVEDVGISVTTQSTVAAYTAIDTLDKFYDYTAYRRLSEDFIKIGQIATRSGTAVEIGNYNLTVNSAASVMESITGSTITIKSGSLAAGSKYTTIIATPPKLVTAATTEIITANIEDGNGDSSVTIQGGSGNFTLWKLLNSVPDDDYATGTNLGNVGNVTYRFLHADGYKIIIRDNSTAYRISCPMEKGIYTRGLFFGDQVQLAQSAEVTQINTKVDILTNNVAAVPAAVLASTVETGATVAESLRLHNSVLGGKVSGAGTGTETFRDLADTKDRLISSVDANGNRTAEVADLT